MYVGVHMPHSKSSKHKHRHKRRHSSRRPHHSSGHDHHGNSHDHHSNGHDYFSNGHDNHGNGHYFDDDRESEALATDGGVAYGHEYHEVPMKYHKSHSVPNNQYLATPLPLMDTVGTGSHQSPNKVGNGYQVHGLHCSRLKCIAILLVSSWYPLHDMVLHCALIKVHM